MRELSHITRFLRVLVFLSEYGDMVSARDRKLHWAKVIAASQKPEVIAKGRGYSSITRACFELLRQQTNIPFSMMNRMSLRRATFFTFGQMIQDTFNRKLRNLNHEFLQLSYIEMLK